jgi:hypothetical protein
LNAWTARCDDSSVKAPEEATLVWPSDTKGMVFCWETEKKFAIAYDGAGEEVFYCGVA